MWQRVTYTALHTKEVIKGGCGMDTENAEIREDHYGKRGLNSRHEPQRLLKWLHQRSMGTGGPPYDPGGTQGMRREEELQILPL